MHLLEVFFEVVFACKATIFGAAAPPVRTVYVLGVMDGFHVPVQIGKPGKSTAFGSGCTAGIYAGKGIAGPATAAVRSLSYLWIL